MSNLIGILEYSKIMIDRYQNKEGLAIDMTLGKGNDCAYLAERFKKVYAFDIQNEAIKICLERFKDIDNLEIINDSHHNFKNYVTEKVDLFIYNLGFLPGFDQNITTLKETTITSLNDALIYLKNKGVIIIVVYCGHQQGYEEALALEEFIEKLDRSKFTISKYEMIANKAPYVICLNKK